MKILATSAADYCEVSLKEVCLMTRPVCTFADQSHAYAKTNPVGFVNFLGGGMPRWSTCLC